MEQSDSTERQVDQSDATTNAPTAANPDFSRMAVPRYVYAVGRVEPRFPSLALEKEAAQAAAQMEGIERHVNRETTEGGVGREALHSVLSEHRYLVRQMCWVLSVEGLDAYVLQPHDPADFALLVDTLRPSPGPTDIDVVIGVQGGMTSPERCNGLMVPIVLFSQIYPFDVESLVESMPRPENVPEEQFRATAQLLMGITDNPGAMDEHRALNYLAVRYPAIYTTTAEADHERNASLSGVHVLPSQLSSTRRIVDVIFSYTNRETNFVEQFCVRVDVTEEFPFLVTGIAPYYYR